MKTLVAYDSKYGATERIAAWADSIADELGARARA